MSLQSYKTDLVSEVNSGCLDPGEAAKLRGLIQFVETEELARGRVPRLPASIIPLPVEIIPSAEEIIDLDDPLPEEPADPSAVA